ncbi:Rap1 Myb domain-containing protein, partial [Phyllosticta citribraziliensis]
MIVITDVSKEPPIKGDLFAGLQFWISQRCPNRIDLVKRVKYNGGEVVLNEKLAQYLIADHERGSLPSGSISYRFILDSVDNQQLEDVENHRCGPPVGSARTTASARPPRHGRVPFSAQDDIDLYRYVTSCKRKKCHINGNEIYKEFAKQNPRHSFQSWRDRYVKHLSVKPPLGASRLTPSPEPGPSESHTNTNDQKTLSETSTKPSNK